MNRQHDSGLWVLGFSGPLLPIDPASGAVTKRFPVRGLGTDVATGTASSG
jgi:hypothetical protein